MAAIPKNDVPAAPDLAYLAFSTADLGFVLACCESEIERSDVSNEQRALVYMLRIHYAKRRRAELDASDVPPPRVVMHDQDSACARGIVHRPPCEAS